MGAAGTGPAAGGGSGERAECGKDVDGSEEGAWHGQKYDLKKCKLRRVTAEEARECFRDKTAVWVGDSVTRFQFLSLVHLLQFGEYPEKKSTGGRKKGMSPNVLESFKPWPRWFAFANEVFKDSMWCNCHRPQANWIGAQTASQMVENRYFSLDSHNISLNLLTSYGSWPMHGHYPPPCMGAAGQEPWNSKQFGHKNREKRPECSLADLNRESVRRARHQFNQSEFDDYPSIGYDWSGSMAYVLKTVAPLFSPDLLYLNYGAWSRMHQDTGKEPFAKGVFQAAQASLCSRGTKCVWKRTTYSSHSSADAAPPPDEFPLKYAHQLKWDIFDAATVTKTVFTYKDEFHFLGNVYDELNNLLLNRICPKGGGVF